MRGIVGNGMGLVALALVSVSLFPRAWAAGEIAVGGDYPELQVTPRASERVEREARSEDELGWWGLPQAQLPALALLTSSTVLAINHSGAAQERFTAGVAGAGIGIGAAGLLGSTLISKFYRPMQTARDALKSEAAGKPREQLARERYAEESLRSASRSMGIFRWSLGLLNLGASAAVISQAKGDAFVLGSGAVGAVTSLLPLLFPTRWETVACEQELYKKKIYGPVGSQIRLDPVVLPAAQQGAASKSALQLSWNYRF